MTSYVVNAGRHYIEYREAEEWYIYHSSWPQVFEILPENIDTLENIILFNKLFALLLKHQGIHRPTFTIARWQEYNKQPVDCFLEWIKEEHPEEEPFEADYIGPEMKDTRTKFGMHIENGNRIYYD